LNTTERQGISTMSIEADRSDSTFGQGGQPMRVNNATLTMGTIAMRVALYGSAPERSHPVLQPGPGVLTTKTIETVVDKETGEQRYEMVDIEPKAGP
jgi:hypothetical protein